MDETGGLETKINAFLMTRPHVSRPLAINTILLDCTIDDLKQRYADVVGVSLAQVFHNRLEADNSITLAVREERTLGDDYMGEAGEFIGTFTINHMLKINCDREDMYIISSDKSIYEPLYDSFTALLGELRLKKLNHLL